MIAFQTGKAYHYPIDLFFRSPRRAKGMGNCMRQERPGIPKKLIEEFCQKHHIRRLSIFGSYLREEFGPESDIDFLVEFDEEQTPGYFELASMEQELSDLLGGCKTDLRTPKEISRYFRDKVMAEAEVQYARR
jgi:hypothetical protein